MGDLGEASRLHAALVDDKKKHYLEDIHKDLGVDKEGIWKQILR